MENIKLIAINNISEKIKDLWEAIVMKTSLSGKRTTKSKRGVKKVPLKSKLDNVFDVASCKCVFFNSY